MRVRSLGKKYSAHLPAKKNKLLFKRVFGSETSWVDFPCQLWQFFKHSIPFQWPQVFVWELFHMKVAQQVFTAQTRMLCQLYSGARAKFRWLLKICGGWLLLTLSEDFFSLPCGSIFGISQVVAIAMQAIGGFRGGGRMSWCHERRWRHEAFATWMWWIFFIPFTQDDLAFFDFFATNNFSSRKKKLEKIFFFDVCVYFFPGMSFLSFWFLKKLWLEVTKAPLGRPTVILTIQASRHVYLEDHPQDLLGSNPPRENEPWNWAIRKGNFAQELGTYLLNGMILQVGWKILGGIMVVQCPLLGCPAST